MARLFARDGLHGLRRDAASLVYVDHVALGSLRSSLLKLVDHSERFRLLAFLNQAFKLLDQGFDVGLFTQITRGAALVLAQIFDGGVLVRHRFAAKTKCI